MPWCISQYETGEFMSRDLLSSSANGMLLLQVEHCELSIVCNRTKFQVNLRCKLETTKQALIAIVDELNITSDVPTDRSSNM